MKFFYFKYLFVFLTINLFSQYKGGIGRGDASATLLSAPLPIELSSFEGNLYYSSIKLSWQTTSETNNYGFEVERSELSAERQAWEKIGFINGSGNSNSPKNYSFIDQSPVGGSKFYYRLKQIDNDGTYTFSDIIGINYIPAAFALFQNFPNPFNPVTKIRYQIPVANKVIIKVYNILGIEIAELINEQKQPGIYEIDFSGDAYASGVYIYKIVSGAFTKSGKMVLLK